MSDVIAIRHLLANHAPLTAVVPAANIQPGPMPLGTTIPAISIAHISGVWNSQVSTQGRQCTARVQVTVKAATYPQQKQIIALVRAAVPRTRGVVNGVSVDSIQRLPDGPDFGDDDVGIFMQTQDFMVRYNE